MSALDVTEEYIRGFFQANDTFLYQLVFDPRTRKLRPLSDYPDEIDNPSEVCQPNNKKDKLKVFHKQLLCPRRTLER